MFPLIVITGPTASGKSEVAIELGSRLKTEIISADSMQVYRYFNIGTARPGPAQMEVIPHHLIDIVDPDSEFTAGEFRILALDIIKGLHRKGKTPLIVGGTGLYIKVLTEGLECAVKSDHEVRKRIKDEFREKGELYMYNKLKEIDPVTAGRIHPNDRVRIERGLEVFYLSGIPISEYHSTQSKFDVNYFVLNRKREEVYKRIEKRVDRMISNGLLEEVKGILNMGYSKRLKPFQSLGYLQMIRYLDGEIDFDDAVREIKKETKRYAKRQLTWFRGVKDAQWIDIMDEERPDDIAEKIFRACHHFGVLQNSYRQ